MIAALAKTVSRFQKDVRDGSLGAIIIFCGIGLLLSLVAIILGFDFSDALF